MAEHDHTEHVDGCFRCDLASDEALSEAAEQALTFITGTLASHAPAVVQLDAGNGYVLVRRDHMQRWNAG